MALLAYDGFDGYLADGSGIPLLGRWTGGNDGPQVIAGQGRNGTAALRGSWQTGLYRTFGAHATWIVGQALKLPAYPTVQAGNLPNLLQLEDGIGTLQLCVRVSDAGFLQVVRGNNVAVLGTSTYQYPLNVFHYLELKAVIGDSGSYELRVDGSVVLLSTGDTQATANASANCVRLGNSNGLAATGTLYRDDVYICDGSGSAPYNAPLGDVRVERGTLTGPGATTGLSRTGAATNWQAVNESPPPDDDTSYVAATAGGGLKDTYTHAGLSAAIQTVYAVQVIPYSKKTDVGSAQLRAVVRRSGTDYESGDQLPGTSYGHYPVLWTADPSTSAAWTPSGVNAAEVGVKVV